MITEITVQHPLIHRLDLEPFWRLSKGQLVAVGGEYFGRRDTGGLDNQSFFDDMEKDPEAGLEHAKACFNLVTQYRWGCNSSGQDLRRELHTVNVGLTALALEGAAEELLASIADLPNYSCPDIEVREMTKRLSHREFEIVRENVRILKKRAGVLALLDDIDDNGEEDPRWPYLFNEVAGIKLAKPMSEKILHGGLENLSVAARGMVLAITTAREERVIVVEAVPNRGHVASIHGKFDGFTNLYVQSHQLQGERRRRPREEDVLLPGVNAVP